jgi:uncharacterized protein (UPF0548 family)
LLEPKTSDVLIINVKTVSGLGVRPDGNTCVGVTRVLSLASVAVYRIASRVQEGEEEDEDEGFMYQAWEVEA